MSLNEYSTERLRAELENRERISQAAEQAPQVTPPPAYARPPRTAPAARQDAHPEDPWMQEQVSRFTQEGNTDGSTADHEILEITMQAVPGGGDFYVLRTKTGWSFDEIEELVAVLEKAARTMREKPAEVHRHIDMS